MYGNGKSQKHYFSKVIVISDFIFTSMLAQNSEYLVQSIYIKGKKLKIEINVGVATKRIMKYLRVYLCNVDKIPMFIELR